MCLLIPGSAKPSTAAVRAVVTALVLLHGQGGAGGSNSSLQTMSSGLASLHNGVWTFVKQGAALGNQSNHLMAKIAILCQCKSLCWSNLTCKAFSYSSHDGHCATGQDYTNFVPSPSSTMVYKVENPVMGTKRSDGLYYHLINEDVLLADARSRCEQMPGFRLAIARTKQTLDVIKTYGGGMLDLIRESPLSELKWGDQTLVDPTIFAPGEPVVNNGDSRLFEIYAGTVDDISASSSPPCRPLCQANFDKIDW